MNVGPTNKESEPINTNGLQELLEKYELWPTDNTPVNFLKVLSDLSR